MTFSKSNATLAALASTALLFAGCSASRSFPNPTPTEDGGLVPPEDGSSPGVDLGDVPPPVDAGGDPYATPTVCSSGTNWTGGTRRSASMEPGMACITCHARSRGAPRFDVAGTVYATAHEPDACNGTNASGAVVIITDANGAEYRLPPNAVGNFSARGTGMVMPYTARVESTAGVRAMLAPQTNGDCNACHTLAGTSSAPGRIMLP